ncbi:hypothetical protein [Actinomadura sp. WAC 06369]|uniref:hypothetical protein n=1 Tax=Actinomadura sp. WAC 06369 TaxID=2203193 RepID=UPI000F778488|nr:hypothetical protein [Actinomadura sp. WAC 06369]RSN67407.1 hypothetical protein DMH08_13440 [Actinomadura sp. WAC 06369]
MDRARRVRLTATAVLAALVVVPLIWPAVLAYTLHFGERGTATVAECTSFKGRNSATTCRGTWRTEGGRTGRGEIYGLGPRTPAGRTVPVRIGPAGPYANGWSSRTLPTALAPIAFVTAPAVLAVPLIVRMRRAVHRRGRRLAAELLAGPGALVVSRDAVRRPDGSPYATLRPVPAPVPGHRRLDLPGRPRRPHPPAPGTAPGRPAAEFASLDDPAGRTLLYCEHRTDTEFEPEIVLLDPSGAPRLLVRRESPHPLAYRLLDPSGADLGSARTATGIGTLAVRDAAGTRVAAAGLRGRDWVLRADATAPEALRDAALVLVLAQFRTHDFT